MRLNSLKAFKVLDSRGEPAIGIKAKKFWAGAPSGASIGKSELSAYPHGVDYAITLFNKKIAPALSDFRLSSFSDFPELESTVWKLAGPSQLGANTMIALEYAILKELANDRKVEIYELFGKPKTPRLLSNVIGGGAHASSGAPDFQEFLVCQKTRSFSEAAFTNAAMHSGLKAELAKLDPTFRGGKTDEGAWITGLSVVDILSLLRKECGNKVELGVDIAASELYSGGRYKLNNFAGKRRLALSVDSYYSKILEIARKFKLAYIEDPFYETDFASFARLNKELKSVCGDDITATNPILLDKAVQLKAVSAVIVKPNQIGSLVLAKKFFDMAKQAGLKTVVSHRSAEMEDAVLAHLALGWGADFLKCGIAGGERVGKINEIIRLEATL